MVLWICSVLILRILQPPHRIVAKAGRGSYGLEDARRGERRNGAGDRRVRGDMPCKLHDKARSVGAREDEGHEAALGSAHGLAQLYRGHPMHRRSVDQKQPISWFKAGVAVEGRAVGVAVDVQQLRDPDDLRARRVRREMARALREESPSAAPLSASPHPLHPHPHPHHNPHLRCSSR